MIRIPAGVTWFHPGSHALLPKCRSEAFDNLYYVGDYVRSRHGSWSQEKAYVTGMEAANAIMGRDISRVIPLKEAEAHVAAGASAVSAARSIFPFLPSISGFAL